MSRTLSEKQVLKKLGIEDFRHLSKDKVMALATALPHMDPEVAKKALEQFPDFANAVRGALGDYRAVAEKALEAGKDGSKDVIATYMVVMSSLEKTLEQDDLTFDQRMEVMDRMREIADAIYKCDKDAKDFILEVLKGMGVVVLSASALVLAALGGNAMIKK